MPRANPSTEYRYRTALPSSSSETADTCRDPTDCGDSIDDRRGFVTKFPFSIDNVPLIWYNRKVRGH